MVLEEVKKPKFAEINDKRYYFSDNVVSLPFAYPYLKEIIDYKEKKNEKKEKFIQSEKKTASKVTVFPYLETFSSKF